MLLAIDIGNTNIVLGVFEGDKILAHWRIATSVHRMSDEYAALILTLLKQKDIDNVKINGVVICSVVPPALVCMEDFSRKYLGVEPLVVEAGVKTGVRISMDNPREVGADRIVNAVAVHHLYGGPVIVIDMGTATTFDAVSAEGDYLGGAIAPGIAIATEALFTRTSVLPRVELHHPQKAIGRNTIAAMQAGIVFGYVGLIEGIVARIKKELGSEAKVIASGGYASLLAEQTQAIDEVNNDLTLIGLRLIYLMNQAG